MVALQQSIGYPSGMPSMLAYLQASRRCLLWQQICLVDRQDQSHIPVEPALLPLVLTLHTSRGSLTMYQACVCCAGLQQPCCGRDQQQEQAHCKQGQDNSTVQIEHIQWDKLISLAASKLLLLQ